MNGIGFQGFSRELPAFFAGLSENNTTGWFQAHRDTWDKKILEPARRFIEDMGDRLATIDPGIVADPRIDKSIFRLNRDVRFSKDKSPFKTHLGIWFWNNAGGRMESCGFYFHIEQNRFMMGTGNYMFMGDQLERYRQAVADSRRGAALEKAIKKVKATGDYGIAGEHYKRVPRGYDPNHPRAALLRYNSLYAYQETPLPEELYSAEFIDYCFSRCVDVLPVHKWLLDTIT